MKKIRAIPPSMDNRAEWPRYFPSFYLEDEQLQEALAEGAIKPWRIDACGNAWYETHQPMIRGEQSDIATLIESDDDDGGDRALWRYRRLIEARANGRDIPPQFAAEVLADAGKTLDEFDTDVAEHVEILDYLAADGYDDE